MIDGDSWLVMIDGELNLVHSSWCSATVILLRGSGD